MSLSPLGCSQRARFKLLWSPLARESHEHDHEDGDSLVDHHVVSCRTLCCSSATALIGNDDGCSSSRHRLNFHVLLFIGGRHGTTQLSIFLAIVPSVLTGLNITGSSFWAWATRITCRYLCVPGPCLRRVQVRPRTMLNTCSHHQHGTSRSPCSVRLYGVFDGALCRCHLAAYLKDASESREFSFQCQGCLG